MMDTEHLDRVERFAGWLEERRRQAGLTQEELAAASGISHSYYSKICHVGQLRRAHGDNSKQVVAPRKIDPFEGALRALEDRIGDGLREEGLRVWNSSHVHSHRDTTTVTAQDKDRLVMDTAVKMMKLSEDSLRLVAELVSRLS